MSLDNSEVFHETFDNYDGSYCPSCDWSYLVYKAALARSAGENGSAYIITLADIYHYGDTLTIISDRQVEMADKLDGTSSTPLTM